MDIEYTTRVHKEGEMYVAHAQELDVSSAGKTVDDARAHLDEAVTLLLEEAANIGTLDDLLEEAGYLRVKTEWKPPEAVSTVRRHLTVPVGAR